MSKYEKYNIRPSREKRWRIHPLWRGVGCLLLIIVPIAAYAGSFILVRENNERHWVEVPREVMGYLSLPFDLGRIYYLNLLVAVALIVVIFALITVLYGIIYSSFGPPRYGPMDSPPVGKFDKRSRPGGANRR